MDPEEIDEQADEATAGLDDSERERIQQRVAAMNARLRRPGPARAAQRGHGRALGGPLAPQMRKFIGVPGKGMIVCATREICADLYERIIALKPDWHSRRHRQGQDQGRLHRRRHRRGARPASTSAARRRTRSIQQRAKDPDDELELVIVQSMLLTGFDSPPLHTIYLDKPMRGAALMQALARVNRTFRNKQDGLLVGYAPLTENLYEALAEYTARDQNTKPHGPRHRRRGRQGPGPARRDRRRDPRRLRLAGAAGGQGRRGRT